MKHTALPGMAIVACMAISWGVVYAGGFQITAHSVSPGGGASSGGCRRLEATLGEPVNGSSAGSSFVVVAGFQARIAAYERDSIFNDGFQECL